MTTIFYDNWRDVLEGAWRWKNFSPAAIAAAEWGKLLSTGCRRSVTLRATIRPPSFWGRYRPATTADIEQPRPADLGPARGHSITLQAASGTLSGP